MRISDWSSDVFSSDLFDDVAGRFNRTLCHSDRFEQHLNVQLVATKHYLAPAEIIADRRQRLVELVREGRCHRTHRIHARYVNTLVLQLLGLRLSLFHHRKIDRRRNNPTQVSSSRINMKTDMKSDGMGKARKERK